METKPINKYEDYKFLEVCGSFPTRGPTRVTLQYSLELRLINKARKKKR